MLSINLMQALDPVLFAREALGFLPDPWQEKVLRWSGKGLLLNCSRQSGKSTTAASLALHRAKFFPSSLVLLISPSQRQSSELFRKVQEFLKSLPADQQPKLIEDNKLSLTLRNKSRIVSLPGKEGTIRGFSGADLIIEDEAARVPDELYIAVRPMLAVSGGRIILMSTPFGKRGHFFREWTEGGDSWERIMITARECPRISPEFLEEEKAAMGDWWFRQEYLCEFVETVDQVFNYDLVQAAIDDDIEPLFGGVESA
ncbi:MAG: terminase large subunit domain-containing protein [Acetivibrionales bacterium]|jgi:hypothetical protein